MIIDNRPEIFDPQLAAHIRQNPLIAVLVIDELEAALPLAKALLDGGIKVMELTLRTTAALEAAKLIHQKLPEMTLGLGTVLTTQQVAAAKDVGAAFAVAPGLNPNVLKAAREQALSFAPGIVTPSDIEQALEYGCRLMKFFPAETSGGLKHLCSMAGPYAHMNISFIPLGGLNETNMIDYLAEPIVDAIGGSWIAPRPLIQARDWSAITERARLASSIATKILGGNHE